MLGRAHALAAIALLVCVNSAGAAQSRLRRGGLSASAEGSAHEGQLVVGGNGELSVEEMKAACTAAILNVFLDAAKRNVTIDQFTMNPTVAAVCLLDHRVGSSRLHDDAGGHFGFLDLVAKLLQDRLSLPFSGADGELRCPTTVPYQGPAGGVAADSTDSLAAELAAEAAREQEGVARDGDGDQSGGATRVVVAPDSADGQPEGVAVEVLTRVMTSEEWGAPVPKDLRPEGEGAAPAGDSQGAEEEEAARAEDGSAAEAATAGHGEEKAEAGAGEGAEPDASDESGSGAEGAAEATGSEGAGPAAATGSAPAAAQTGPDGEEAPEAAGDAAVTGPGTASSATGSASSSSPELVDTPLTEEEMNDLITDIVRPAPEGGGAAGGATGLDAGTGAAESVRLERELDEAAREAEEALKEAMKIVEEGEASDAEEVVEAVEAEAEAAAKEEAAAAAKEEEQQQQAAEGQTGGSEAPPPSSQTGGSEEEAGGDEEDVGAIKVPALEEAKANPPSDLEEVVRRELEDDEEAQQAEKKLKQPSEELAAAEEEQEGQEGEAAEEAGSTGAAAEQEDDDEEAAEEAGSTGAAAEQGDDVAAGSGGDDADGSHSSGSAADSDLPPLPPHRSEGEPEGDDAEPETVASHLLGDTVGACWTQCHNEHSTAAGQEFHSCMWSCMHPFHTRWTEPAQECLVACEHSKDDLAAYAPCVTRCYTDKQVDTDDDHHASLLVRAA